MSSRLGGGFWVELQRLGRNDAVAGLLFELGSLGLDGLPLLALKVGQVLHVLLVCIGLAVCGQLYVVPLLGRIGLSLERLFTCRVQLLPSVADELGDLCKRQVLVLDLFSNLI